MNHTQIILAWKDSSYRAHLSSEELALLPSHPAGLPLSDAELETAVGQIALSFFGCSSTDRSFQSSFYDPGTVFIDNSSFDRSFPVESFYGD